MWWGYANLEIENQTCEAILVYVVKVALLDFSERTRVKKISRSRKGEVLFSERFNSDDKILNPY